jgi:hypothetical protein
MFELTATFNPDEVLNIVRKYLVQEGYTVKDISIKFENVITSIGNSERSEMMFKGIEAKIITRKD